MDTKNGGPAFPVSTISSIDSESGSYGHQDGAVTWQFPGMTMRDYFAAKAMQGELAREECGGTVIPSLANLAYEIADAMIAARETK